VVSSVESTLPLWRVVSGCIAASPLVASGSVASSESVARICAGVVGREKGGRDICVGVSGCWGVVASA